MRASKAQGTQLRRARRARSLADSDYFSLSFTSNIKPSSHKTVDLDLVTSSHGVLKGEDIELNI